MILMKECLAWGMSELQCFSPGDSLAMRSNPRKLDCRVSVILPIHSVFPTLSWISNYRRWHGRLFSIVTLSPQFGRFESHSLSSHSFVGWTTRCQLQWGKSYTSFYGLFPRKKSHQKFLNFIFGSWHRSTGCQLRKMIGCKSRRCTQKSRAEHVLQIRLINLCVFYYLIEN